MQGAVARMKRLAEVKQAAADMKARRDAAGEAPTEHETFCETLARRLQYFHCCERAPCCHKHVETHFEPDALSEAIKESEGDGGGDGGETEVPSNTTTTTTEDI